MDCFVNSLKLPLFEYGHKAGWISSCKICSWDSWSLKSKITLKYCSGPLSCFVLTQQLYSVKLTHVWRSLSTKSKTTMALLCVNWRLLVKDLSYDTHVYQRMLSLTAMWRWCRRVLSFIFQVVRAFGNMEWNDPRILRSLREREKGEGILAA